MCHYLFHTPTEGYLGCLQVWAVTNKVVTNISEQICVGLSFHSWVGNNVRIYREIIKLFQNGCTILHSYSIERVSIPHL